MHSIAPVRKSGPGSNPWPFAIPGEVEATRWIASLNLRPGDRVALAGLNTLATAQLLVAGLRYGLTFVLLNRRLTAAELADQLERSACVRILADPAHPVTAARTHDAIPAIFNGDASVGSQPTGALELFTSGTTGTPKTVHLSNAALVAATTAHVAALRLTPQDTWACPLPLDHIGGAMCVLRAVISGCRVHLHERFDANALSDDLDASATGTSVVPTMLRRLIECRAGRRWPTHLRCVLSGGGPLDDIIARACVDLGLPPSQTYGLTEMGSMVTVLDPADWAAHPHSAGRPIPGAQVRIVDGRIEVAGPMQGTLEPRTANYESRTPAWFTTDDLGSLDADGFLTVHGRIAERIISGGENISAPDVEAAIASHPAVSDVAVCGLPDAEWGEIVAAVVVSRREVCTEELVTHLAKSLAPFKRPKRWAFVDEIPRTGAGKVKRAELRGLFRG